MILPSEKMFFVIIQAASSSHFVGVIFPKKENEEGGSTDFCNAMEMCLT